MCEGAGLGGNINRHGACWNSVRGRGVYGGGLGGSPRILSVVGPGIGVQVSACRQRRRIRRCLDTTAFLQHSATVQVDSGNANNNCQAQNDKHYDFARSLRYSAFTSCDQHYSLLHIWKVLGYRSGL
jgi:hypothetical protein